MPNTASAKKEQRKTAKRRLLNRSQRSALRTAVKKARTAVETGEADSEASLKAAVKKLDQAASKNLIHKNTAARTKSRLAKLSKKKTAAAPAS
jgi:small subunit ribosomal protein S20